MDHPGLSLVMPPNTSSRCTLKRFISFEWLPLVRDSEGILKEYVQPVVKWNTVIIRWNEPMAWFLFVFATYPFFFSLSAMPTTW